MNDKNDRLSPTKTTLEVIRKGDAPQCVETGRIDCRSCSGWAAMKEAIQDPASPWRRYPIHCACTGLTVRVRPDDPEK